MQLTVTNLNYTYDDAPTSALGPIQTTFPEGWTGVVGPNGSGKSTLLRLLTGDMGGYTGSVLPCPTVTPGGAPAYCAQATENPPAQLEDFAVDYSGDALRIRDVLGIDDEWAWRFETLSHGERKRLQVAVALWLNPPVLALDEPTNHVDAVTRDRLSAALRSYDGVGLLVSHDRELLDELCGQCLFMRAGKGVLRSGNYSQGHEQELLELKTITRERKAAKQELSHLRNEQIRRANEAARADSRRSKAKIDPKDKDAKARIDLAIFTGQDGKAGKLSTQMGARVQAAEKRVMSAHVPKVYDGSFWLSTEASKRRILVSVPGGSLPMGDRRSICFPRLDVENTSHIGVTGPNGTGKSTFVNHLVKSLPVDIPVLWMPQELSAGQTGRILADLKELDPARRGQVLSLVARLNSDPDRILSGESLSPGELRKILLARGVLEKPQLIIMDEPTNHLDLRSIEALETVLAQCPCALVLVSHDARFLEAVVSSYWRFTPEGCVIEELR